MSASDRFAQEPESGPTAGGWFAWLLGLLLLAGRVHAGVGPGDDFNANTTAAATALQGWYNPSSGLWNSTGWWNAANCLDILETALVANNGQTFLPVLTNTYNLNVAGGFLNNYYDDEGWWALAWIRAFDLTGDPRYLTTAKAIFADLTGGWDTSCNGGIWWSKDRTYKNAIANELFLLVAIRLHQRTPHDTGTGNYYTWALREWNWFSASGLINARHLVNDGLTSACQNNGQTTWTYNQGVILGGLIELYKYSGDSNYLTTAIQIANAAITNLSDANGILHEPCESGGCGGDGPQFKGIFLRYLALLYDETRLAVYGTFLFNNAHAIWNSDRNAANQLGLVWSGPFDSADAARQSSALAPIAALAEPATVALPFAKGAGDPAFSHPLGAPAGTLAWIANATNATRADFLQYGPYTASLATGPHTAHFRLAVSTLSNSAAALVQLDVRENNGGASLVVLAAPWSAFTNANQPQDFALAFTNATAGDPLEFRVLWNHVPSAPALTITDVTVDGAHNWLAANLAHDVGRLDGLNAWEADPVRDPAAGYLTHGPGTSELPAGSYTASFELKVDNFNLDSNTVATLSIVDTDTGVPAAASSLTRNQFPNTLYQTFGLNFAPVPGHHYDYRVWWPAGPTAPRLTQRSVIVAPGTNSLFTGAQVIRGRPTLSFVGVPGRAYTVLSTTNLAKPAWSPIGSLTLPAAVPIGQFTDTNISLPVARYYRLQSP